ncbi:MAG TPA: DUF72 domain-containing protein [Luteitalea sp.]|nr:DUF72 domain-containing protein [Luteitalea sp.]
MIHVGTSGYNYPEWKGRFYPEKIAAKAMLPYYAGTFDTVEINYTFYRMPTAALVEGWAAQVPDGFTFTLKTPKRITHDRRLQDVADSVRAFCTAGAALGNRLGCVLVQLGPTFKADVPRLRAFIDELPPGLRAAFEFRHESWWSDEVYDVLRQRNLALCLADSPDRHTPLVATADYGYLRLRDEGYTDDDLARWAGWVDEQQATWRDTFVYFKHEDEGKGPEFAQRFRARLAGGPPLPATADQ